jgi:hypothetical protein
MFKRNKEVSMLDARFGRLVRILTEGCTRAGAYERLYADIEPLRQGWARRLFVPSLLMEE